MFGGGYRVRFLLDSGGYYERERENNRDNQESLDDLFDYVVRPERMVFPFHDRITPLKRIGAPLSPYHKEMARHEKEHNPRQYDYVGGVEPG